MTYDQRLPDPCLHKGHSNPSTESNSVRVFIQCLAAIDTLDYYHLYIGPYWLVLLQSDAITYNFKTSLTEKA